MGGAMKDLDTSVKESLTAQSSDHIADAGKVIAEPVQEPVAYVGWYALLTEDKDK